MEASQLRKNQNFLNHWSRKVEKEKISMLLENIQRQLLLISYRSHLKTQFET